MSALFNLPSSILSTIYAMDSTYRDKFREEINKEIFTKCIDTFCKKNINKDRFFYEPQIGPEKVVILLKYVFDVYNVFPDEITIRHNHRKEIFVSVRNIETHKLIFEGSVFTIIQYNNKLDELNSGNIIMKILAGSIQRNIVFQNDSFVIHKYEDEEDD